MLAPAVAAGSAVGSKQPSPFWVRRVGAATTTRIEGTKARHAPDDYVPSRRRSQGADIGPPSSGRARNRLLGRRPSLHSLLASDYRHSISGGTDVHNTNHARQRKNAAGAKAEAREQPRGARAPALDRRRPCPSPPVDVVSDRRLRRRPQAGRALPVRRSEPTGRHAESRFASALRRRLRRRLQAVRALPVRPSEPTGRHAGSRIASALRRRLRRRLQAGRALPVRPSAETPLAVPTRGRAGSARASFRGTRASVRSTDRHAGNRKAPS